MLIFSILNHPRSFLVYYDFFSVFLSYQANIFCFPHAEGYFARRRKRLKISWRTSFKIHDIEVWDVLDESGRFYKRLKLSDFVPKNGIRIARSKYHVTLSVTSRWCHKHSMQFEHSIVLLLLSFLRDRNHLIPRYSCLLSRSTSLFPSETPQCQQLSRVSLWMWRHVGAKLGPVPWPFVTSKWPNFKRS